MADGALFSKDVLGVFGLLTTMTVAGVASAVAAWNATRAIRSNEAQQRANHEASDYLQRVKITHEMYSEILKTASENPLLSVGAVKLPDNDKTRESVYGLEGASSSDNITFIKYEWYIARLLNACERILSVEESKEWKSTIKNQIKTHSKYFSSTWFTDGKRAGYEGNINDIIDEALSELSRCGATSEGAAT